MRAQDKLRHVWGVQIEEDNGIASADFTVKWLVPKGEHYMDSVAKLIKRIEDFADQLERGQ